MYFSNVSRVKRKEKRGYPDPSYPGARKLPQRVPKKMGRVDSREYEIDPMTCPKCQRRMKIIGLIQNEEVIDKILKHVGL